MMNKNNELEWSGPDQCPEVRDLKMLTGCIIHDINNILMAIKGNVSLILSEKAQDKPITQRLENIQECIQNASELSYEILSFIKNEKAGREKINLNILIGKIRRIYRRIFRGVAITEEYQKEILLTEVNRSQMERVVLNMFINAWKAMPEGGSIHVCTDNVSFAENLKMMNGKQHSHYVKITIADTGIGMDSETKKKIFEPFFSNRKDQSGAGMGLTSVQRIINAHDGFIHVHSQQNQGSKFEIFIPALSGATGRI